MLSMMICGNHEFSEQDDINLDLGKFDSFREDDENYTVLKKVAKTIRRQKINWKCCNM